MQSKRVAGVLIAIVAIFSGYSIAHGKSQGGMLPVQQERCERRFASLDTDEDGRVSLDEFKAISEKPGPLVEQLFNTRDGDGDGFLTRGEMCSRKGKLRPQGKGASPPAGSQ